MMAATAKTNSTVKCIRLYYYATKSDFCFIKYFLMQRYIQLNDYCLLKDYGTINSPYLPFKFTSCLGPMRG